MTFSENQFILFALLVSLPIVVVAIVIVVILCEIIVLMVMFRPLGCVILFVRYVMAV